MIRHRASRTVLILGVVGAVSGPTARGADTAPTVAKSQVSQPAITPEITILQALQANPATAPYRFAVTRKDRQYALSGRVGTKQIHDAAIQTAIALGYPVRDDLTIDTGAVYLAAASQPAGPATMPGSTGLAYVYPPPLFGRLDDPFFGFEPPLVSYPPWWKAVAAREPINLAALNAASSPMMAQSAGGAPMSLGSPSMSGPATDRPEPPPGTIDMTLDTRGVAVLRGRVNTLADRVAVGQKVAGTPGISQVVNLLQVGGSTSPRQFSDTPPPPPTPAFPAPAAREPQAPRIDPAAPAPAPAAEKAAVTATGDALARRVADTISRRPALDALPLKVTARDGTVTLAGKTPSAYEAMLAFRAAQQTPGVRDVVDRMEFPIPDADAANPLRDKGRPEDVESYLLSQVRRQVGDLAHVDQVRVRGDTVEIHGSVGQGDDVPRVEAALRSVPLLRGFRIDPTFVAE